MWLFPESFRSETVVVPIDCVPFLGILAVYAVIHLVRCNKGPTRNPKRHSCLSSTGYSFWASEFTQNLYLLFQVPLQSAHAWTEKLFLSTQASQGAAHKPDMTRNYEYILVKHHCRGLVCRCLVRSSLTRTATMLSLEGGPILHLRLCTAHSQTKNTSALHLLSSDGIVVTNEPCLLIVAIVTQ